MRVGNLKVLEQRPSHSERLLPSPDSSCGHCALHWTSLELCAVVCTEQAGSPVLGYDGNSYETLHC